MNIERDITDEIEKKQLTWFGHTKRMSQERWPRKILEWVPPERRKRGRPRRSWREDVNDAMKARNLEENTCYDRKNWKLGTERRRQPQIIRIYIYIDHSNETEPFGNTYKPDPSIIYSFKLIMQEFLFGYNLIVAYFHYIHGEFISIRKILKTKYSEIYFSKIVLS